jgi:flavin-dependent dehydrogenase
MRSFDVLVIGGGPAGATAALLLARAGRSVAVVEKADFPRRKVCGEYIAPPAADFLRSLGMSLQPEVRRIAVWAGKRVLCAPMPAPYASTLAREDLDAFLLQCAARAGAWVFQPLKVLALERSSAGFACKTETGNLEARAVVAAHGSWEPGALPTQARRSAPQASDLLAFKAHFGGVALSADTIALAPFAGGYGGVLMLGDGRATFACCIRRDALEALRRPGIAAGESVLRHALRASVGLRDAFAGARRDGAWLASGPLRPGLRAPYRDGVFAVGNAAGEVHPIVGQGISLAMQSAALLCRTFDSPGTYQRECRTLYFRALWPSALATRLAPHARAPWLLTLGARLADPARSWTAASAAPRAAPHRP